MAYGYGSYACHRVTTIYSCVDIAFRFHMFKQLNLRAQTRLPFFNRPRALGPAAVRPDRTIQTRQFYLSARDQLFFINCSVLGEMFDTLEYSHDVVRLQHFLNFK